MAPRYTSVDPPLLQFRFHQHHPATIQPWSRPLPTQQSTLSHFTPYHQYHQHPPQPRHLVPGYQVDSPSIVQLPYWAGPFVDPDSFEIPRPPPSRPLYPYIPQKRDNSHLSPKARAFISHRGRGASSRNPKPISNKHHSEPRRGIRGRRTHTPAVDSIDSQPETVLGTPHLGSRATLDQHYGDFERIPSDLRGHGLGSPELLAHEMLPAPESMRLAPRASRLQPTAPSFRPRNESSQPNTPLSALWTTRPRRSPTPGLFLHHSPPEGYPPHSAYRAEACPGVVELPLPPSRIEPYGLVTYLRWADAYEQGRYIRDVNFISDHADRFWRETEAEVQPSGHRDVRPSTPEPRDDPRSESPSPRAPKARYLVSGPLPRSIGTSASLRAQHGLSHEVATQNRQHRVSFADDDDDERNISWRLVPCAPTPLDEDISERHYIVVSRSPTPDLIHSSSASIGSDDEL